MPSRTKTGSTGKPNEPTVPRRMTIAARETPATPLVEGRHLLDTLSWTALLPLLLAALGQIFLQAAKLRQLRGVEIDQLQAAHTAARGQRSPTTPAATR